MKNLSCKRFLTGSLAAGIIASSLLTAAPADAQTSTGTFRPYTSPAGVSSQYHVYANNIDWSLPVGVVFYFDGDYWFSNQSKVYYPESNSDLKQMAQIANSRNMLFVPVISPDKNNSGDGITWWEDYNRNGDWFRSYANWFINATGTDRNNIWTIGYSGGAEFETLELGADRQTSWRNGGGTIMVGGGTTYGMQTTPDDAAKRMSYQWYEGTNDGEGATWPKEWSAYGAGWESYTVYGRVGYWNRKFTPIPNTNHYQYNFPSILTESLDRAGVKRPGFALKGAIREKYFASGAEGKYGKPTTNEFALVDNGVGQAFANNYTIYWRESTGAHPVKFAGAIGNLYKVNGYENKFGYPTTDETSAASGGAYQSFKRADGRAYTLGWHELTGANTIFENGAIGVKFNAQGRFNGLGYPASDEHSFRGGTRQFFYQPAKNQRTAVYWSEGTGAHSLNDRGAISALWVANGYKHGLPIADETATARGGASAFFRDANGAETGYFWSEGTGAHAVNSKGALYWYWKQHGFIDGMGFPTHDERVESDGKVHLRFSDGTHLTWSESEGVKVAK